MINKLHKIIFNTNLMNGFRINKHFSAFKFLFFNRWHWFCYLLRMKCVYRVTRNTNFFAWMKNDDDKRWDKERRGAETRPTYSCMTERCCLKFSRLRAQFCYSRSANSQLDVLLILLIISRNLVFGQAFREQYEILVNFRQE